MNNIIINKAFTEPIVIHYEFITEETDTHYFVSAAKRVISLNKCSVTHNKKGKTMTILKETY